MLDLDKSLFLHKTKKYTHAMYILRPLPMKNLNFTLRRSRFCLKSGYNFILVNLLNLLNYYVLVSINKFYITELKIWIQKYFAGSGFE